MPVTLSAEISVAAGASVGNLLEGTRYLSLPNRRGAYRIWACQTGADAGTVVINGSAGNSVQIDKAAVRSTAAGVGPELDKHRVGTVVGVPFDPMVFEVINNDAANASEFRYQIEIVHR